MAASSNQRGTRNQKPETKSFLLQRLRGQALITSTKLSKALPGIDSVVVPVAEHKLDAVAPNVFRAQNCQIVGNGSRIEDSQPGYFTDTIGAQTLRPKIFDWKYAEVTI